MTDKPKGILTNWRFILGAIAVLVIVWAFLPSSATREGAMAEARAKDAIISAKKHEERADELQKAADKEKPIQAAIKVERDALAKDKSALTAQVARLRAGLPPRPVVGQGSGAPGPAVDSHGVAVPGEDGSLVQQLYDVIDTQAELIAKHEEDDIKSEAFIASLQRAQASMAGSNAELRAANTDLLQALVQKDLQIKAMKSANLGALVKAFLYGVAFGGAGGAYAMR